MSELQIKKDPRSTVIETLLDEIDNNKDILVCVADSTSTAKISPLESKYPKRVINLGIAEQVMVGTAVGLAMEGHTVLTMNASPFLISRACEQVKVDVCYNNVNVKLIGLNAGFTYGPLGSTHHSIDDISTMLGFGNIEIFSPCDNIETKQILQYALSTKKPTYIRVESSMVEDIHDTSYEFKLGNIDILHQGTDIAIVTLGSIAYEAMSSLSELKKIGCNPTIINLSSIRPLDSDVLIKELSKYNNVVTVEEHSVNGGVGSIISKHIAENNLSLKLNSLGVANGKFSKAGARNLLREVNKIDSNAIIKVCTEIRNNSGG